MNQHDRQITASNEAIVEYLDADFKIVRPGTFVRCAVTGEAILLDELRYWSVDRQEAYAAREVVLARLKALGRKTGPS